MIGDTSRSAIFQSVAIHALVLGLFAILITLFQRPDPGPEPIEVVFYKPGERVVPPAPPAPISEPEIEPEPKIEPPVVAQADPPPKPRPKPEPVEEIRIAKAEPPPKPKPEPVVTKQALAPEPKQVTPKRPRREVKTNLLNASVAQPAAKPRTERRKTTTGAFAKPGSEDIPTRPRALRGGTQVGGFAVADNVGPDKPPSRAVVQTSGFGDSSAAASAGSRPQADPGSVQTGGFASTAKASRPRATRTVTTEAPDTPVEVLSKPTPVYTAKARELRVQGEVTLRVTFVASGRIQVVEVVEGLGHGLDEAAIEATKKIRFKPARRDGRPVDHTAVLRIVFQLV